nr:MarR family transcriptional regulator [Nocardioides panaciterrulae]
MSRPVSEERSPSQRSPLPRPCGTGAGVAGAAAEGDDTLAVCNNCTVPDKKPDTTDDLVTALLRSSRVLVAVAARSLAEVEDVVTVTQFRTLVVLSGRGGTTLRALAESLDVNASTAQRMVERLVAGGLVSRRTGDTDRRQVALELTDEGRQVVERVTERRRKEIARIVRRMPAETRAAFVAAVDAFGDAAEEPRVGAVEEILWGWATGSATAGNV